MKAAAQIRKRRLILHIKGHERLHLRRRRYGTVIDTIRTSPMGKMVLALRGPDGLYEQLLPEISNRGPLLRRRRAEVQSELAVTPFQMPISAHHENRLRELVHSIRHHIVDIVDDAHTVSVKTALPITAALPCEQSKQHP